ncbi:MAG: energy-coupling factor transporter transmembrane component T [Candidatus Bathyarchaeia archaeon]
MAFEYVPGNTFFHKLDPRVKFLWWVVVMIMAVGLGTDPIYLGVVFISIFVVMRLANIPFNKVTSFLKGMAPVVAMYAIFNLLFPPIATDVKNPYIFFYLIPARTLPVSLEACIWTAGAVLRFLMILLVIRTILMITPIRDIIITFVKLKLPADFALALSIGLAYVPVLIDENTKIKEAQQARGWRYEYRNPAKRFNALLKQMFVPAIFNSMRRTGDIAIAIESRGFSHDIARRTYVRQLKYTRSDYIVTAVLLLAMLVGLAVGTWGLHWASYVNVARMIRQFLPSSSS